MIRKGARSSRQNDDDEDDDDDDDGGCRHACFAITFMSVQATATAWSASLLTEGARGMGGACNQASPS